MGERGALVLHVSGHTGPSRGYNREGAIVERTGGSYTPGFSAGHILENVQQRYHIRTAPESCDGCRQCPGGEPTR